MSTHESTKGQLEYSQRTSGGAPFQSMILSPSDPKLPPGPDLGGRRKNRDFLFFFSFLYMTFSRSRDPLFSL